VSLDGTAPAGHHGLSVMELAAARSRVTRTGPRHRSRQPPGRGQRNGLRWRCVAEVVIDALSNDFAA
jgi:hypothetical protein